MVQWWALWLDRPQRKTAHMTGYEQCIAADGRWHVETVLQQNSEKTRQENVEFSFYLDASGQPRIDVRSFGVFTRSTSRGTWKLEKTRRRRVTKAERLKLLDHAKRLVGQYAVVELVPVELKEPLPLIEPGAERMREPGSIGDGFSTIKVFTCALNDGFGTLCTVPRFWKALLVIQMWAGNRLIEMKVYGIGVNWFRTLEKQGVPNGIPDERQRAILKSYFEQRADTIARQFHSYAMEHCRFPNDAMILSDVDPKGRVQ
jgi:hypothetical protein